MARISRAARLARACAWLALVVGIAAIVLVAIAGPLYRHQMLGLGGAFGLLRKGAWVGVAAFGAGVLTLIATLATRRFITAIVALIAIGLGVVSFGGPYLMQQKAQSVPPIHDIATDPMHPPRFIALAGERKNTPNGLEYAGGGARMAGAETGALQKFFASPGQRAKPGYKTAAQACNTWGADCLAAVQNVWYPHVKPLQLASTTPDHAYQAALALARGAGWKIVAADGASRRIEATATTAWFGFKDDVAIKVTPGNPGSVVNMRSESRLGLSDLGTNAERVRDYLGKLAERLEPGQ